MTERAGSGRAHKRARKTARPTKKGSSPATPDLDGQDTGGRSTIQHQLLDLQRRAGNRAVTGIVDRLGRSAIQRVEVTDTKMSETLYDKAGTGGKAKAKDYAITPSYVLTRNGDSGLTVKVRVKFLHQVRDNTGALKDDPVEIPTTDPDDRRGWAEKLVKEQSKPWNGHVTFAGEEVNVFSDNTKKRLPVTFESVAVFGLDDPYDNIVIIHPSSVAAGSPGQKIDAGNYYINQGTYKADTNVIAAHEYGHLIGVPDEYSQSNEQMNALLHQAAPKTAPSAQAALDKKTVERMVLSSLRTPLIAALNAAMPSATDALRAKRAAVKKQLGAAARAGVKEPAVRAELERQLASGADPSLAKAVPKTVAFETTKNFSNLTLADTTVEAGFTAADLATMIRDKYWQALWGAEKANVAVEGLGDVSINIQQSVRNTTATGGAQAGDAATAAGTAVGGPGGPATFFGLPLIVPPSGLIGQLMAIPSTWGTAGSALEAGVTPAAFSAKMEAILKVTGAAESIARLVGLGPAEVTKHRDLYTRAYGMVNSAAATAAKELTADLLNTVIPPVINTGVTDLQSSIQTEVEKVMGTPPSGIAALGSNPAMANLVNAMKARLDADKTASAGGGRDPVGTGKAAPDQDVTYSYQGLMGSHGTMAIREDQLNPLLKQFNLRCLTLWEKPFKAEVK
ncbi:MAG TPA: hypothetical protein VNT24_00890 [Propionibacteriaceae bacterium]|nr:hypothetical protein [Propionibacteriaceae bacterium]